MRGEKGIFILDKLISKMLLKDISRIEYKIFGRNEKKNIFYVDNICIFINGVF